MIANRTLTRATNLCSKLKHQAQAVKLDVLSEILHRFDVVISCTGSDTAVISSEMVQAALNQRAAKPVFMLDLAVPRDIELGAEKSARCDVIYNRRYGRTC